MKLGDLTTLANVKAWMASTNYIQRSEEGNTSVDDLLRRLIPAVSRSVLNYLERRWILPRDYNEVYNGVGSRTIVLRNWPVLSINSLSVSGRSIPVSTIQSGGTQSYGYLLEPWSGIPPGRHQALSLSGGGFHAGLQNVSVGYRAGYQVTSEPATVPASPEGKTTSEVAAEQPYGTWGSDVGVMYSGGEALVAVSDTPTAPGTYRVKPIDEGNPLSPPGIYEFHEGDAAAQVLLTYGYVPASLEQAVISLVVERLAYRQRVGEISRNLAQQISVRYDVSAIPDYIKSDLQPYKNVLPI